MVRELQERMARVERFTPEQVLREIDNLRTHIDQRFLSTDMAVRRVQNEVDRLDKDLTELGKRVADILQNHEERLVTIAAVLGEHGQLLEAIADSHPRPAEAAAGMRDPWIGRQPG
jgi:predicted  nucleic acid-binding Zn-ribbon protein